MQRAFMFLVATVTTVLAAPAGADPVEIYCTIRSGGQNLNCQTEGKDRKVMSAEDVINFVDAGEVAAYVSLKSRKGIERTFMLDARSPQYKHLSEVKRSASVSEIAKSKSDLFAEIEKKVIKVSDDLDAQAPSAELILWDPGVMYDKFHRETRALATELEGYRKKGDKSCAGETAKLQQTLGNLAFAFQTPNTCMSSFKILKERDGSIDVRQFDGAAEQYKQSCKR